MGQEPKLRLSAVQKRHGSFVALDGISLDIAAGTFFVIVGPSGCGKTTLLRLLAGLDTPTSGTIEVQQPAPGRASNSVVFQGDSLFPWMTVWENASFGVAMRGVPRAEAEHKVEHYLRRVGLLHARDRYPHQLSGGMRQRVSIARAFANDPEVLLMDEPFSAVDEQNKIVLQQELLQIWEESQTTVVFITHSVDEAVTLGDRIMVMTASGGTKSLIDIDLPRPRDVLELRHTPRYGEIVYNIWGLLREEVSVSRAASAGADG